MSLNALSVRKASIRVFPVIYHALIALPIQYHQEEVRQLLHVFVTPVFLALAVRAYPVLPALTRPFQAMGHVLIATTKNHSSTLQGRYKGHKRVSSVDQEHIRTFPVQAHCV